jgi:uncharacterized protein
VGLIYLDTCLVIYVIENHPDAAHRVRAAMARKPVENFAVSPLVRMECLVKPLLGAAVRSTTAVPSSGPTTIAYRRQLTASLSTYWPEGLRLGAAQRVSACPPHSGADEARSVYLFLLIH